MDIIYIYIYLYVYIYIYIYTYNPSRTNLPTTDGRDLGCQFLSYRIDSRKNTYDIISVVMIVMVSIIIISSSSSSIVIVIITTSITISIYSYHAILSDEVARMQGVESVELMSVRGPTKDPLY